MAAFTDTVEIPTGNQEFPAFPYFLQEEVNIQAIFSLDGHIPMGSHHDEYSLRNSTYITITLTHPTQRCRMHKRASIELATRRLNKYCIPETK